MVDVSQGTINEYSNDESIGGLYVKFKDEDGGYILSNADIVEESLRLEETLTNKDAFSFNCANSTAIEFKVSKDSAIGDMDIVGKKFDAFHYVRLSQDDPVFMMANSLFGGDILSNNAERLKPYVEQAIDQLDEQGFERYYGHELKVFDYKWQYSDYIVDHREKDPDTQEWYNVYREKIITATGHYTYITPTTALDSGQLYFVVNANRLMLWGNINVNIRASIVQASNTGYGKIPPDYQTQEQIVLTSITYKATYAPYSNLRALGRAGKYIIDLKISLIDVDTVPFDDGSYNIRIVQYNTSNNTVGNILTLKMADGKYLEEQAIIEMNANCAYIRAFVVGKNGQVDMQVIESDGEIAFTTCNVYPVELVPLGEYTVNSCPAIIDGSDIRTLKAYDGLYNSKIDKDKTVTYATAPSLGDVLNDFVTDITGIEFGNEKYSVDKAIEFASSTGDFTMSVTFPDGTVEEVVLASAYYDIVDYDDTLSYDFVFRTFEDSECVIRHLYDLESKYGIRQKVAMWDSDGKANPMFDREWYLEYLDIQNLMQNTNFYTPTSISSSGRFSMTIIKSVSITIAGESAAYYEVIANKGTSQNGVINMQDPLVRLANDLMYEEKSWWYFKSITFFINTGGTEPKEVKRGGAVKKGGTRLWYDVLAPSYQSQFYKMQEFIFQGPFRQPVKVTYAVAKYRVYLTANDGEDYWGINSADWAEIKVTDHAKNMTQGIMSQILSALYRGNIVDGQGNLYNSADSSVLSSLSSYIESNASKNDIKVYGDGVPYPSTSAYFDFVTPLAYYITRYHSTEAPQSGETQEFESCNVSKMLEWHSTNTLFDTVMSASTLTAKPRELLGAYAEINGMFFALDRKDNTPQFIKLRNPSVGGFPEIDVYPSEDLYPGDCDNLEGVIMNGGLIKMSLYNNGNPLKFKGVRIWKNNSIVTTVDLEDIGITVSDLSERVWYDVRDNVIIDEFSLNSTKLADIAEFILTNIWEIEITTASVEMIGAPYLQLGDMVTFLGQGKDIHILNRRLKGISALYDTLETNYEIIKED